jgi:polysaccharide export outer membrane protein
MGMSFLRLCAVAAVSAALAGCQLLPRSGPEHSTIDTQASSTLTSPEEGGSAIKYVAVDINANTLQYLTDPGAGSLQSSFGTPRRGAPALTIGTGDVVQVTIFESSSGGLFIPSDAGSRPGNYVILPNQTVDQSGMISVPYAGLIKASGRTLSQIQREIETKLKNRAIEPQVVVALVNQRSNEVAVVGDVGAPTKVQVNAAGERVLDIISKAGGIRNPGYETYVTIQRAGRKSTIFFPYLVQRPEENIFVSAGDTVYVYREQSNFQAFGATGQVGRYNFDAEKVSFAEAVGRAGGLLDDRANPGQTFIYRTEARSTLEKMGVDLSNFPPRQTQIPTVYRANFRDPSTFFAAQKFQMRNKDTIYVSNAESVELYKFLTLVSAVPNTAGNIANDVYAINNAGVKVKYR